MQASTKNLSQLELLIWLFESHKSWVKKVADLMAEDIGKISCTIPMLVGEQDKLFGSVTSKDIEEALVQEGINISRKRIILEEPIRSLGVYTVEVRLHTNVTAKLKVWVVAK